MGGAGRCDAMKITLPTRVIDGNVGLRPLRDEDAAAYAGAFVADPELGRMLGTEQDPDESWVRDRVKSHERRAAEGTSVPLAIVDRDAFCGAVSVFAFDPHHRRCEVGYWGQP
jgi:RimJ/RimL family protein N-acetyltransferase